MKELFYDLEIINCIPDEVMNPKYVYCMGWKDFEGMGISVIGFNYLGEFDYLVIDPKINPCANTDLQAFRKIIIKANRIIGFNSKVFDDNLMAANNIEVKTNYDFLCEVRLASGQPESFTPEKTRPGYSLDALAKANLNYSKTGNGALAPQLWQNGKHQEVIDYCLNDVRLLFDLYQKREQIIDPTNGDILKLRN